MLFNYKGTINYDGELDIDSIGNCAIRITAEDTSESYLVIKTKLGVSEIFDHGPIIPDLPILPKRCHSSYQKLSYNESKLHTLIDKFLNPSYMVISKAEVISIDEALSNCIDIIKYMKELN